MRQSIQDFAMQEQQSYRSRFRLGLWCFVLVAALPILSCGDPAAGTIKAPKREEITGGNPGAGAPSAPAKAKPRGGREVELKPMAPGGKKM